MARRRGIRRRSGRPLNRLGRDTLELMKQRAERGLDLASTAWDESTKDMLRQPGKGRVYDKEIRMIGGQPRILRTREHPEGVPRPPHQASRPGDPPASDTGRGLASIGWDRVSRFVRRLGSGAKHMLYQERGTRFSEPRPWIHQSIRRALRVMRAGLRTGLQGR